ncbi:hypothetical protein CIB95_00250 [Lottiidibacillus patelloidae]|uniref:Uncharacterized protein n=1 Tax=Lottiidibacillus patelloidae TaxID=2670334 RepID=A0A263BY08_9BACI|nr:hypothetical protein [Lottiidibacillus patelloidae]OZM58046.1 hypothetical protein CIB95_00250 [Lottiidibacillus patelloidae]
MYKKWTFISTIAILLTISFYIVPKQQLGMKVISIHANFIEATTLEQLENKTDLIVIATTSQAFLDRKHVFKYMKDNNGNDLPGITDLFTRTEIIIEKIIKQPEDEKFAINDKLQIIEPISYDARKKVKVTLAHYEELEVNETYILFLGKNTFGNYSLLNMNNGKFKLKNLNSDSKANNLHDKLAKQVHQKYKEKYLN